jgi:ribosome-binding factor A
MPDSRRLLRLQQLILETLATAVHTELDDPRVTGVTITRVKLARDLTQAVVYWSTLAEGGPRRTAERGLADATAYLQARVAEVMATRLTPHLTMRFDESQEKAARLGSIFERLAHERGETPASEAPPAPDAGAEAEEDEG